MAENSSHGGSFIPLYESHYLFRCSKGMTVGRGQHHLDQCINTTGRHALLTPATGRRENQGPKSPQNSSSLNRVLRMVLLLCKRSPLNIPVIPERGVRGRILHSWLRGHRPSFGVVCVIKFRSFCWCLCWSGKSGSFYLLPKAPALIPRLSTIRHVPICRSTSQHLPVKTSINTLTSLTTVLTAAA